MAPSMFSLFVLHPPAKFRQFPCCRTPAESQIRLPPLTGITLFLGAGMDWAAREAREWDEPELDEIFFRGLS